MTLLCIDEIKVTPKMKDKAQSLLFAPTAGEWVSVRREDLEFAVKYLNYSEFDSYSEWSRDRRLEAKGIIDRLKTVLDKDGEE